MGRERPAELSLDPVTFQWLGLSSRTFQPLLRGAGALGAALVRGCGCNF